MINMKFVKSLFVMSTQFCSFINAAYLFVDLKNISIVWVVKKLKKNDVGWRGSARAGRISSVFL